MFLMLVYLYCKNNVFILYLYFMITVNVYLFPIDIDINPSSQYVNIIHWNCLIIFV